MNRGNAGVIGTLVTPSISVATGVFSLNQLQVAAKNGTWPPFVVPDPYFNYVTMLLPGNGTNGAQNNTFLDSSTNNLTITRNGNTTQGTFAPYGNNWSNYFDGGSTNLLSFPSSSTAYNLSGAAWTVQFWVYSSLTTFSDGACRVLMAGANGTNTAWVLSIEPNYSLTFGVPFGGTTNIATASNALTRNTWTHVAVVYSGGTARIYFNGVSVAGPTAITLPVSSTVSFKIGYDNIGTVSTRFNGYISNVAINTTTALYTSAFTPPTTPLTAVSGTGLLTCQSNRFVDNSTNALAITVNGNTSVQRFSPFSPTASYAPNVDGGSGYFDGTGDSLVSASSASNILSTNDFTIEFWLYPSNTSVAYRALVSSENYSAITGGWSLYQNGAALELWVSPNSSAVITASAALTAGAWQHIALSRVSGTLRLFVNGTQAGSIGTGAAFTGQQVWIGDNNAPSFDYFVIGYMSDVRIVNGTGLYTTAFTPPTAPLTAVTNTSFLANFTNAGIIDNAEMNNLETVGNAQISTGQSKFGGASIYIPANAANVYIPPSSNFDFGTGDFTVESWVYSVNTGIGLFPTFISSVTGWSAGASGHRFNNTGTANKFSFHLNGAGDPFIVSANTFSFNVWYHYALTRSGNTWRMFVNGNLEATGTYSAAFNQALGGIRLGYAQWDGANGYYNGYLDDLRITKGYARYTANFTPPTAPFPTL
jgi:hypothetical protein